MLVRQALRGFHFTNSLCGRQSAVRSQLGCSALFPLVLPDPHVVELELRESDDFLVLANKRLWEVVSEQEAVQEVRAAPSPLLAAKRLQDVAQSYGCEDNISVLVLRLGALTASVHCVVQELNSTLRRNSVSKRHAVSALSRAAKPGPALPRSARERQLSGH